MESDFFEILFHRLVKSLLRELVNIKVFNHLRPTKHIPYGGLLSHSAFT